MQVRIKLIEPRARIPERAYPSDAGADLFAVHAAVISPGKIAKIDIGIALEIPRGYEGQIRPRSGLLSSGIVGMLGTVDAGYRGSIAAILLNTTHELFRVSIGDKIAQLVIAPCWLGVFEPCGEDELSPSARSTNGFGSSGNGPRRVPSNGG